MRPCSPWVLALGWLWLAGLTHAQQLQVQQSVFLREADARQATFYVVFPNINVVDEFRDAELLRDIQRAETRADMATTERLLSLYVKSFGVQNFRQDKDLALVWKLGQLHMARNDTAKAVYYFGLALKNQSPVDKQVQLYYDTLRAPTANPWVDLDYYYDIVAKRRKIDTLIPPKGVLLNMGKKINSPAPDYAPYMHPSNSVLIFTSRRNNFDLISPDFAQNEDLYYAQTNLFGEGFEHAERFQDEINSQYNEGSACLNTAATEIIFTRCNAPDGLGVCDLYMADWANGRWVNVRNLGPNVNSADWDSHPSLSPDNNTLFFTSNRGGGFGRHDIWMSRRRVDGSWGPAQNLGPVVNTYNDEITPFLHPVNNTLYFSSRGHLNNFGGFDIFKARWMGNHWEEPRNLGPLVNTSGDEYYFSLDGKGETLFYANASREEPRNFDLYSFPMPMEARPDAIVKLRGYLIDSVSGYPIRGIVVAIDRDKGTEVAPIQISPTGYFEFQLVGNRNYTLLILGDNAINIAENVPLRRDTLAAILTRSIDLVKPVVFRSLQFARNSADIEPHTLAALQEIGTFLQEHPYVRLTIRGHTDADGDEAFNLTLSKARALNIRRMLLGMGGIPDSSVVAEGYGASRPVQPNDSPEHKAANRRVEFELYVPPGFRERLRDVPLFTDDRTRRPAPPAAADSLIAPEPMVLRPLTTPKLDSTAVAAAPAAKPSAATPTAEPEPDDLDALLGEDDLDALDAVSEEDLGIGELENLDTEDLSSLMLDLLEEEAGAEPDADVPPDEPVDPKKVEEDVDAMDFGATDEEDGGS